MTTAKKTKKVADTLESLKSAAYDARPAARKEIAAAEDKLATLVEKKDEAAEVVSKAETKFEEAVDKVRTVICELDKLKCNLAKLDQICGDTGMVLRNSATVNSLGAASIGYRT